MAIVSYPLLFHTIGSLTIGFAFQASKLRWRLYDKNVKPLTFANAFYLATKGGDEFFGKVGSFENGYEFDAVVLDDSALLHPQPLDLLQRLERFAYLSGDVCGGVVVFAAG